MATFVAALVVIVGPRDFAWSHGFMIGGSGAQTVNGHPLALGDHLQTTYFMWLWWHALTTRSHIPMVDPFQFALTGHRTVVLAGWPLVLVSIPVTAIAGPVAAFNAVVVVSFVATASCAYLLASRLGITRAGATVVAFGYAFAPYRFIQAGHIGTYLGFLPPLVLYLADRAIREERDNVRWAIGCILTYVSLVISGELHILLYTTAVFASFVVIRSIGVPRERLRSLAPAAIALVLLSGLCVGAIYHFILAPSPHNTNAVSIDVAPLYAPRIANLFHPRLATEQYDYPGAVIALLALIGGIQGLRSSKRRRLVLWLGAVVAVSYLLAMAPGWSPAFHIFKLLPFSGFIRVPGRILVAAVLALGLLAGFGVTVLERRLPSWVVLPIVLVLLVADVRPEAGAFSYTAAGHNVLKAVPKGAAVMDLPPFPPFHHGASRYMLDLTRHPGPRANGYNVLAPEAVWDGQQRTWVLAKLPVDPCAWKKLSDRMHFRYTAVHADLFGPPPLWPIDQMEAYPVTGAALDSSLDKTPGFHRLSVIDDTTVYRIVPAELRC